MKLSDILKTSCKSHSMKFLEVSNSWNYEDPTIWRDNGKKFIQGITKDFCIQLKEIENKRLYQLQLELQNLHTQKNKDQIKTNNIESEIEEIERHHQKGAMIRSRTKLIENEEKPTEFFYTAEKQNQNKKNITKLKNKNGELKTEDKEILKIAQEFYSDLYKKAQTNQQEQETFLSEYNKKISNEWHLSLTKPFEEKELFQALKSMEENESPGKDGSLWNSTLRSGP